MTLLKNNLPCFREIANFIENPVYAGRRQKLPITQNTSIYIFYRDHIVCWQNPFHSIKLLPAHQLYPVSLMQAAGEPLRSTLTGNHHFHDDTPVIKRRIILGTHYAGQEFS
jgi:hypothetical protein